MGLFDAIRVGLSGLQAAQTGLEAAQSNVANVNTRGYARLRTTQEEIVLGISPGQFIPGGARVRGVESVRDAFLDARAALGRANVASSDATLGQLSALEASVAPGGRSAIGSSLDSFFASLSELSARPEDPALRSAVLDRSQGLASQLSGLARAASAQLQGLQGELGLRAERANSLTSRIAGLNRDVAASAPDTAGRNALVTNRTALIEDLAAEIDVRSFQDEHGRVTLTLDDGTPLVSGSTSFALSADPQAGGRVLLDGQDVTGSIRSGAIGGLLAARSGSIVPTLQRLDDIAQSLATEINAVHNLGTDANGAPGVDVFGVGSGTSPGAIAGGFQLLLSSGSEIAAGLSTAPGDGRNALALAGLGSLANAVSIGGSSTSFTGAAASLSARVGADARGAGDGRLTAVALRDQAIAAREQLSGVSLDEEAADLVRYQRAFQASSRFLATVDGLVGQLLNDLGG